mmetsp:Transcript_11578/g.17285  ORF Transcript_11578/g.17285 Transcript_11578/m.17285 type:complete len:861 (-) Transcript_11578:344-2926(-)|eukprot:CAMPEP_0167757178 /NCGR_PEP_ID=MMETSP0110_2-20121227/9784_1 /TAXON_ID=629695 /ORGANISM="Gymnochlora sp., Strain CCMP2014" /LENGTH=860 /DNA_ID=CAMNT_0007643345 /DNA_START=62 /DNA_END=2644 /DNA_ORIENTATION=+
MACSFRTVYDKYFDVLKKVKWVIIVFWLAALGLGAGFGFKFLSAVSIEVDAPKGTKGYDAQNAFKDLFPVQSDVQNYLLFFECFDCISANNTKMKDKVLRAVKAAGDAKSGYITSNETFWTYEGQPGDFTPQQSRLISSTNPRAMIAILSATPEYDTTILRSFVEKLRDSLNDIKGDYDIGLLGSNTVLVDSIVESSTTITMIDLIVLPIALMVLMYVVQSWRMVIIPIINVATTMLSSFAIMYGLTKITARAPSFVPSVMEAMVIALSIDYSLFLLTRYRFELLNKGNHANNMEESYVQHAVRETVFHAGEVVFMSGLTLVSCFLGMTGFPTQTVYMVGVGCSICLTMALLINLTMTPAMLLAFPRFFATFQFLPFCTRKEDLSVQSSEIHIPVDDGENQYAIRRESSEEMKAEPSIEENKQTLEKSYWYCSTKKCIKWPYVLLTILVPLALITPAAIHILDFKYSIANEQIAPRNSDSTSVQKKIESNFALGLMNPLYVIVDASSHGPGSIEHPDFFEATSLLSELLVNHTKCKKAGEVSSIAYGLGISISYNTSVKLRGSGGYYPVFYNNSINENSDATLITMITPFAPYGDETKDFTKNVRDLLESGKLPSKYSYYLAGAPIWIVDTTELTYELFPYIILATVLAIFLFIAILLVSAFIPIRYAFTLVFPLSFIFGVAVLIYQKGALNGLGWDALKSTDGMYWLSPIITFPICTGLALDYDIFLICRVAEYRRMGYTDKASILKAVHETGGIITAAGIIMAIAFGGMLFSKTDTLNQIAWILFSSVLFDTFVVRTILVPAVVSIAGPVNYWPQRVPKTDLRNEFGEVVVGLESKYNILAGSGYDEHTELKDKATIQ